MGAEGGQMAGSACGTGLGAGASYEAGTWLCQATMLELVLELALVLRLIPVLVLIPDSVQELATEMALALEPVPLSWSHLQLWSWGPNGHLSMDGACPSTSGGSALELTPEPALSSIAGARCCAGEALALPRPQQPWLRCCPRGWALRRQGWGGQGPLTAQKAQVNEPRNLSASSCVM